MNIKDSIEKSLQILKNKGIDRRTIEKDLDYAEFYIDQIISKGGNKKFLNRLSKYVVEKSNKNVSHETSLNEPDELYTKKNYPIRTLKKSF